MKSFVRISLTCNLKVFLITGCSSGIGIETARAMAATGARVFLAVRSVEKAQAVCGSFLEAGRVELLLCDTSSFSSVRKAAAEFLGRSPTLNVLVCNAGIMSVPHREESIDGFESQLATNYLGHFLLFWLLRDVMLKASTPMFNSRLVNVSSSGHQLSEVQFDDINFEKEGTYTPNEAYAQSKLAQIYMANYVDRNYGPQGIHALSVMPGGILTNLQQHMSDSAIKNWKSNEELMRWLKSPQQGAATTVLAALGTEWEGKGGKYLENCTVAPLSPLVPSISGVKDYAYDESKEDRLWDFTLKILKLDT
jgi:NAD(P)-dependent dehydrogenase (short-subunit alcohol dehydrogenase family)